ncbi:MAG: Uncharacterised protein [Gammaproteobacteria bacterium]|nr:MAG: Uncharacterised protein [Gammaproteobacteria bacterium]
MSQDTGAPMADFSMNMSQLKLVELIGVRK